MEMHQVRYFLAVAKHLNFTRAAEELRVAQPSLTRAIQKLESELDGPLFRRERSNTHLTELGRMMLPHLQTAFTAAETAKGQARHLTKREVGSLLLGVGIAVETDAVAGLLSGVVGEIQGLDIGVEVAPSGAVERGLLAGEFDAAVLSLTEGSHDRFDLHPLGDEAAVVAFPAFHRFASLPSVDIEELDAEPLIVRTGCRFDEELVARLKARGLVRLARHRSNDPRWIAALVRHGLGCAVMTRSAAMAGGLAHCSVDGLDLRHRTALVTVAGRRHSGPLTALIQRIGARSAHAP